MFSFFFPFFLLPFKMGIRCRLIYNHLPMAESMTGGAPKDETVTLNTG